MIREGEASAEPLSRWTIRGSAGASPSRHSGHIQLSETAAGRQLRARCRTVWPEHVLTGRCVPLYWAVKDLSTSLSFTQEVRTMAKKKVARSPPRRRSPRRTMGKRCCGCK